MKQETVLMLLKISSGGKKNDKKVAAKILKMVLLFEKEPFSGIGKPEPLKHELSGCWSRRINAEH